MLGIGLFIVLLALGTRAFLALRQESEARTEFGQSSQLDWLALGFSARPCCIAHRPKAVTAHCSACCCRHLLCIRPYGGIAPEKFTGVLGH